MKKSTMREHIPKENEEDKLAKELGNEIRDALLDWISLKWGAVYTLGRISSILSAAKKMKFSKKDTIVEIPFSDLMTAIQKFEEECDDTEEVQSEEE